MLCFLPFQFLSSFIIWNLSPYLGSSGKRRRKRSDRDIDDIVDDKEMEIEEVQNDLLVALTKYDS